MWGRGGGWEGGVGRQRVSCWRREEGGKGRYGVEVHRRMAEGPRRVVRNGCVCWLYRVQHRVRRLTSSPSACPQGSSTCTYSVICDSSDPTSVMIHHDDDGDDDGGDDDG
eukprot:3245710-Rhodomonas_salina.1